ncbi:MAG: PH domain-containing protein [Planctomycetes bacterium]|nr:PH domain-containing protein [Planctomycetota bacterium]
MPVLLQAIAGVSPQRENVIMFVYPSVAEWGLGRMLGRLYHSWAAAALFAGALTLAAILGAMALFDAEDPQTRYYGWFCVIVAVLFGGLTLCAVLKQKINGLEPSILLFPLPAAPLAALVYLLQKFGGRRYVLTNRGVSVWRMRLGKQKQLVKAVPLGQIHDILIEEPPGYRFYKAGDLSVVDGRGVEVVRLAAIPRPNVFRQIILEARDARMRVEEALATIQARQPA